MEALRQQIKTAKEALDVARKNPLDAAPSRRGLDRLMRIHKNNVIGAQRALTEAREDYAAESHSPRHEVCIETQKMRDICEAKVIRHMRALADTIERAEVSARTGTLPLPAALETDSLLVD